LSALSPVIIFPIPAVHSLICHHSATQPVSSILQAHLHHFQALMYPTVAVIIQHCLAGAVVLVVVVAIIVIVPAPSSCCHPLSSWHCHGIYNPVCIHGE
jgi:hypothetical protein